MGQPNLSALASMKRQGGRKGGGGRAVRSRSAESARRDDSRRGRGGGTRVAGRRGWGRTAAHGTRSTGAAERCAPRRATRRAAASDMFSGRGRGGGRRGRALGFDEDADVRARRITTAKTCATRRPGPLATSSEGRRSFKGTDDGFKGGIASMSASARRSVGRVGADRDGKTMHHRRRLCRGQATFFARNDQVRRTPVGHPAPLSVSATERSWPINRDLSIHYATKRAEDRNARRIRR